jgi:hypothetical protein
MAQPFHSQAAPKQSRMRTTTPSRKTTVSRSLLSIVAREAAAGARAAEPVGAGMQAAAVGIRRAALLVVDARVAAAAEIALESTAPRRA